jgi:hypothetical protein
MTTQTDRILGDVAYLEHDGIVRETNKAKLFRIHDATIWIPKRRTVLIDEGDEIIGVAQWWAERCGLESDW